MSCPDVNDATYLFTKKFKSILDFHAPFIVYQQRKYHKPWITKQTLELMKERDKYKKVAKDLSLRVGILRPVERKKMLS